LGIKVDLSIQLLVVVLSLMLLLVVVYRPIPTPVPIGTNDLRVATKRLLSAQTRYARGSIFTETIRHEKLRK
jgi:hypothetical protein